VRGIGTDGWLLIRWKPTGRLPDGFIERLRVQQATRLAELTPDDRAEHTLTTGSLRNELGDADGARQAWSTAMDAGGATGTAAALNLGIMAAQAADLAAARRYYQTAIVYGHPAHAPKAAYNLALIARDDGDAVTAAALLREVINSGDPNVSSHAAEALDRLAPDTG
jgi:FimV-like protein